MHRYSNFLIWLPLKQLKIFDFYLNLPLLLQDKLSISLTIDSKFIFRLLGLYAIRQSSSPAQNQSISMFYFIYHLQILFFSSPANPQRTCLGLKFRVTNLFRVRVKLSSHFSPKQLIYLIIEYRLSMPNKYQDTP